MTAEEARKLRERCPVLEHRTVNAISERLPYMDNLLAGVFEKQHYAKKDQVYYGTVPRHDHSKKPNMCNTRHAYNGAIRS